MAKRTREPVKAVVPESNSSEEEEETDASSDSEPETPVVKPTTTTNKPDSSEEEEESDSEPESDPQPKPTTNVTTPLKRPAAAEPKKSDAKKPKVDDSVSNSSKKANFQRIFSDEDEIVILNGMIEFEAKNNVSPTADMGAFHEFVKNKLQVEVVKKQLQDKIQKMKKRYRNTKGKDRSSAKPHDKAVFELSDKLWGDGEKGVSSANGSGSVTRKVKGSENGKKGKKEAAGEDSNVSKKAKATEDGGKKEAAVVVPNGAVEKKALVSKKVKADENATKKEAVVPNGDVEKKTMKEAAAVVPSGDVEKKASFGKMMGSYLGLSNEEKLLKIGAELFDGEEKIAGWEEWKKLEREELELSVKQLDVKHARMKLVLDTME